MAHRPVILSMSGFPDAASLLMEAAKIFQEPQSEVIGHIKINDALHLPDMTGPDLVYALKQIRDDLGVCLDIKAGDTHEELTKIVTHYYPFPDMLTVSALNTLNSFIRIREFSPLTRVALFSIPPEISEENCKKRYHKGRAAKIIHDVLNLEEEYSGVESRPIHEMPFDLIMCSGPEVQQLKQAGLDDNYDFICFNVEDEWMSAKEETDTLGSKEALGKGAEYIVLESQMLKGNPKRGVSASESRRRTAEEIEMERLEGGGHA